MTPCVPHIVGANLEHLAVLELIAKREGIQPQWRNKLVKFLGAFGSLAFATTPLYSYFIW